MAPVGMSIEHVVIALSIDGAIDMNPRRPTRSRITSGIQIFFGIRLKTTARIDRMVADVREKRQWRNRFTL